jgi:hypothetical protein
MLKGGEAEKIISDFINEGIHPFAPTKGPGVYGIYVSHNYMTFPKTRYTPPKLVYIGSSKNVFRRVMSPAHPYRKMYDRFDDKLVTIKDMRIDNYIEAEIILIRHFKPILNKQHHGAY